MTKSNMSIPDISAAIDGLLRETVGGQAFERLSSDTVISEEAPEEYDSLAVAELIAKIEDRFGIDVDFIADDVRYAFRTLANIHEYVLSKLED